MSIRHLARTATVSGCPTAVHAAVEGIDLQELLRDTLFAEPAGMSASARQRGARFEKLLAKNDHERLRRVLTGSLGFSSIGAGQVRDMRSGFPRGVEGFPQRAADSVAPLRQMAAGECAAPVIVAGPVLTYRLGGKVRYAEADFVARRCDGQLVVVEAKAHPLVDGLIVGGPQTGWRLQVSLYANSVADLLATWGYGVAVADEGLLVLPEGHDLKRTTVRSLSIAQDRVTTALILERLGAGR